MICLHRWWMVTVLVCVGWARIGWAEEKVTIHRQAAVVETRVFDPRNPPGDMPAVSKEGGVTRSSFGVGSSFGVQVLKEERVGGMFRSQVRVETISVTVSLGVIIWLPEKAPKPLKEHEEGHRTISESYYKDAEKIARGLAQKVVGRVYAGEGKTAEAAGQAAIGKASAEIQPGYMGATQVPSARVNEIYDEITRHGLNQKVTVEQAIGQAMEQYRKEEAGKKEKTR